MSDNQNAGLEEDNVKPKSAVEEETISQPEPEPQNTDMGPSHQYEAPAATLSEEHQQPEPPKPSRTSTRNREQPDRFGEPVPRNWLKNEGGCNGFKETSRYLEVFFIEVSKNKRRTYLTNFFAMSISDGQRN